MNTRCKHAGTMLGLCIVLLNVLLWGSQASMAIEAPKQPAPPAPAAPPARADIAPTDETAFHRRLQQAARRQALTGLTIPDEVFEQLSEARADAAVATLSTLAQNGDQDANIALVRLQHWCSRLASQGSFDPQAQIGKLSADLPDDRAARAAGVLHAEAEYRRKAAGACRRAQFDFGAIEARLRQAASAGEPASAAELAQFTRDPAQRDAYLQEAAESGYAPAAYALAVTRLRAIQRGETTENVASIRLLLKQAGRDVSRAKLDLANCMSLGCDGHPADSAGARAFGIDAARDGEAGAFLSMARMPWGRRIPRVQLLAWQYFGDRLNEAGCGGEGYIAQATTLAQTIEALEARQDDKLLQQARDRADALWRDYGERAMQEQGCLKG